MSPDATGCRPEIVKNRTINKNRRDFLKTAALVGGSAMVTGHEDDVLFNPMKNHSFALAVFDDSGTDHSKATEPMTLTFARK